MYLPHATDYYLNTDHVQINIMYNLMLSSNIISENYLCKGKNIEIMHFNL